MTVTWEKLPPLDGRRNPCACCPPIPAKLPLDAVIAVGFGDAHASRDGEQVYREPSTYAREIQCPACFGTGHADIKKNVLCGQCGGATRIIDPTAPEPEYWDVAEVEKLAEIDPDHDWRIVLFGPLHGEEYQRQAEGEWLLIEKNQGFA